MVLCGGVIPFFHGRNIILDINKIDYYYVIPIITISAQKRKHFCSA